MPQLTQLELPERHTELTDLTRHLGRSRNIHLTGPRGSGKTLLTHHATNDVNRPTYYLPCRRFNTAYKLFDHLHHEITGHRLGNGYALTELWDRITVTLPNQATVILDDVDFLLTHDTDDAIRRLSRCAGTPSIITTTAHPELAEDALHESTHSSLQPRHIELPPYTAEQVAEIVQRRFTDTDLQPDGEIATFIGEHTQNIRLALLWVDTAGRIDTPVTKPALTASAAAAMDTYRDLHLKHLSTEHDRVMAAVTSVTQTGPASTGTIYNAYQLICNQLGTKPLTQRRVSDILRDFDLLALTQSTYTRGGPEGNTRKVRLREIGV